MWDRVHVTLPHLRLASRDLPKMVAKPNENLPNWICNAGPLQAPNVSWEPPESGDANPDSIPIFRDLVFKKDFISIRHLLPSERTT